MYTLNDKLATLGYVFTVLVVCGAVLMALVAPYIIMAYGSVSIAKVICWVGGVSFVMSLPALFID